MALQFSYGSTTNVITRMFWQYTGTAPTNAQLNTFCSAVATPYGTNLKPLASTEVTLGTVTAVDLSTTSSAQGSAALNVIGTRVGTSLSAQVAAVVSYEVARRYRGGHPRGYWPLGVVTDLATNARNWQAAFVSSLQTDIDAFRTAMIAAGWTGAGTISQVNVSYYHSFTVVVNPVTGRAKNKPTLRGTPVIDQVTSTLARTAIGTQRRRVAP